MACEGHAAHIQAKSAPLISCNNSTRPGAANLRLFATRRLTVALLWPCETFINSYQTFDWRKMDKIYRSWAWINIMFIQTEETPNPATIKFLPGREIVPDGTADFRAEEDAIHSPLAQRLFKVPGVQGVFLGRDFVSVTKGDGADWIMLKSLVMAALMEHLSLEMPIVTEGFSGSQSGGETDDEVSQQIKILLEERVRPMVAMDGGDIVFHRFEDGVVFLQMRGACAGCPSSTATLKMGIENMLKHYVPEVQEVRPVEDHY